MAAAPGNLIQNHSNATNNQARQASSRWLACTCKTRLESGMVTKRGQGQLLADSRRAGQITPWSDSAPERGGKDAICGGDTQEAQARCPKLHNSQQPQRHHQVTCQAAPTSQTIKQPTELRVSCCSFLSSSDQSGVAAPHPAASCSSKLDQLMGCHTRS